jgi:hypothetical protein
MLLIERLEELTKAGNESNKLTKVVRIGGLRWSVRKLFGTDVTMELGKILTKAGKFGSMDEHILVTLEHIHQIILQSLDPLAIRGENRSHDVALFADSQGHRKTWKEVYGNLQGRNWMMV